MSSYGFLQTGPDELLLLDDGADLLIINFSGSQNIYDITLYVVKELDIDLMVMKEFDIELKIRKELEL